MNRKSIAFLAAAVLLASSCGPKTNAPKDIQAIQALKESYLKAWNTSDAVAIASLFTEDAVELSSNEPLLVGREAIRASYQSYFDLFTNEEADVIRDIQVSGDLAVAYGTYTDTSTPKIPCLAVTEGKGKWVSVSRRQADGSWKNVLNAWNTDLPAGRPAEFSGGADEQAILKIEMDWAAALQRNDAAALEPMMADTFAENRAGVLTKKKDYLAGMKAARTKPDAVAVENLRILVFGEFGVVNGRGVAKQTIGGKEKTEAFRFIDTFQKQDGVWKAVSAFLIPEK